LHGIIDLGLWCPKESKLSLISYLNVDFTGCKGDYNVWFVPFYNFHHFFLYLFISPYYIFVDAKEGEINMN
jgi:hypothetical protein